MKILRPEHVSTKKVRVGSTVWLAGGFEYIDADRIDYKAPATVAKITPSRWLNVVPNHTKNITLQFKPTAGGFYYRGPMHCREIWLAEPEDDEALLVANFDAYQKRLADAEAEQFRQIAIEAERLRQVTADAQEQALAANADAVVRTLEHSNDLWYLRCIDRQHVLHQIFFGLRSTVNYYDFAADKVYASGYFIEASSYNTSIYHPELREWHKFSGSNFIPAADIFEAVGRAREWLIKAAW